MSSAIKPSKQSVAAGLAKCIDPELGIDIVSLGLIYDIAITDLKATITMTLTTPGCPLVPYFRQQIIEQVKKASGVDEVEIIITFDPPWTTDKISAGAKAQLTMLRG